MFKYLQKYCIYIYTYMYLCMSPQTWMSSFSWLQSTSWLSTRKLLRCANHGQLLGVYFFFWAPELRSAVYKNEKWLNWIAYRSKWQLFVCLLNFNRLPTKIHEMRTMGSVVYYLQMYLQVFFIGFSWDRKAPTDIKEPFGWFHRETQRRGHGWYSCLQLCEGLPKQYALMALSSSLDQKILVAHQPLPHPRPQENIVNMGRPENWFRSKSQVYSPGN